MTRHYPSGPQQAFHNACYGGEGSFWKYAMTLNGSSLDNATRIELSEVSSRQRYQPQGAPPSDQEVWSLYHNHHCDQGNAHWPQAHVISCQGTIPL